MRVASWFYMKKSVCTLLLAIAGCLLSVGAFAAEAREVTIAVVRDGASPRAAEVLSRVQSEFAALAGTDVRVTWKSPESYSAEWDATRAGAALDAALQDADADIVFCLGILPSQAAACSERRLDKPVVAAPFIDEETFRLPYKANRSTRRNLSYIVIPGRVKRDLTAFKDLVAFSTLHVFIEKEYVAGLPGLKDVAERFEKLLGVEIRLVPVTDDVDIAFTEAVGAEAVYITPLMRLTDAQYGRLVDGLAERNVPSFSFLGRMDVRRGVLAGLASFSGTHLARRIALNLYDILDGAKPEELPVIMHEEERLFINMRTARRIGFHPKYATLLTADLIGMKEEKAGGEPLTLHDAMRIAAKENVDIAVKDAELARAREDSLLARSGMLPQLGAGAHYTQIDQDRAVASRGLYPWDVTAAGVNLTQMLYDDETVSRFRAALRSEDAEAKSHEAVRLDVMQRAGQSFLSYLSARALWDIERENFKLIRKNLEMARVRRTTGVSGPEEVYRWEAAQAESRSRVFARRASANAARTALNQALGRPAETEWDAAPISAETARRALFDVNASAIGGSLEQLDSISSFVADLSAERPVIQALDKLVEAQSILVAQKKRKRWFPSVSASAEYAHEIDKHQAGAVIVQDPDASEDTWTVSIGASVPLFAGGALTHDVKRAEAEMRRLRATRRRLLELAEQQARTVIDRMTRSYPNMELTAIAADRAKKNLEVVSDKYARGALGILDLLDAQNQSRVQEQAAVIAVYTYLGDLIDLQRAVAWFEIDKTPDEKRAFIDRFVALTKE